MSEYNHRITIAVPQAHIPDANQLALIMGESAADDQTFSTARYQDDEGNTYAVASTVITDTFTPRLSQPLVAPDHAPYADIQAATRAQSIAQISTGKAVPDKIRAIQGDRLDSAQGHLQQLELTAIPTEEPI